MERKTTSATWIKGVRVQRGIWEKDQYRIIKFYKTCFSKEWRNPKLTTPFPETKGLLIRPEYIFIQMYIDIALDSYSCYFGKDQVYKGFISITENIDYSSLQRRPEEDYVFLHSGIREPDILHTSYEDALAHKQILFMNPLEGIIASFRHRFETGEKYDLRNITCLSALDKNGKAFEMCTRRDGVFSISSDEKSQKNFMRGAREIVLL